MKKEPTSEPPEPARLGILNKLAFDLILQVLENRFADQGATKLELIAREILLMLDLNHPPQKPLFELIKQVPLSAETISHDLLMSALEGLSPFNSEPERSRFFAEFHRRMQLREAGEAVV